MKTNILFFAAFLTLISCNKAEQQGHANVVPAKQDSNASALPTPSQISPTINAAQKTFLSGVMLGGFDDGAYVDMCLSGALSFNGAELISLADQNAKLTVKWGQAILDQASDNYGCKPTFTLKVISSNGGGDLAFNFDPKIAKNVALKSGDKIIPEVDVSGCYTLQVINFLNPKAAGDLVLPKRSVITSDCNFVVN